MNSANILSTVSNSHLSGFCDGAFGLRGACFMTRVSRRAEALIKQISLFVFSDSRSAASTPSEDLWQNSIKPTRVEDKAPSCPRAALTLASARPGSLMRFHHRGGLFLRTAAALPHCSVSSFLNCDHTDVFLSQRRGWMCLRGHVVESTRELFIWNTQQTKLTDLFSLHTQNLCAAKFVVLPIN